MEILVKEQNNQAVTSSRRIAEIFEKEHYNILRDIEQIISKIGEKSKDLFEMGSYKDGSGKENKMYFMNKDGFTLLAMGFNGDKALEWKLEYIEAFNKMEQMIKEGHRPLPLALTSEVREIREYGAQVVKAVEYLEEAVDEVKKELKKNMELFMQLKKKKKMKEYCMEFIAKSVAGIGTLGQIESVFFGVQDLKDRVKKLERGEK